MKIRPAVVTVVCLVLFVLQQSGIISASDEQAVLSVKVTENARNQTTKLDMSTNVPIRWPLFYNISETELSAKLSPWPKQLPWLPDCLSSYETRLQSGKVNVFVHGDVQKTNFSNAVTSGYAKVRKSCFIDEDKLLTCSCCDGKMLCPTTYERPSAYEPEMKGIMKRMFSGAFDDGIFKAVEWDSDPPGLSITVSGIVFDPRIVTRDECSFTENQPTLIIRNGWLQRLTSPENLAHWLGELFGVVLHSLQLHGIEKIVPLIPHCGGGKNNTGWKYPCRPTKMTYYDHPRPHYASSELRGDWWFQFAEDKGIPFLDSVISPPTHRFMKNKMICFEKLVVACPPPRMSPLSKYTHSISPLIRHWLAKKFSFGETPPTETQGRLLILNRRPGGTRFIANIGELVLQSRNGGWETSVFEFWNCKLNYLKLAELLQNTAVLFGVFGGDLALQAFLRPRAVVIEVSLEHSASVDPFYLFQGIGSQLHFIRWLLRPSAIPELANNPNISSWEEGDIAAPDFFNSWIRSVNNVTLSPPVFQSVLILAQQLL